MTSHGGYAVVDVDDEEIYPVKAVGATTWNSGPISEQNPQPPYQPIAQVVMTQVREDLKVRFPSLPVVQRPGIGPGLDSSSWALRGDSCCEIKPHRELMFCLALRPYLAFFTLLSLRGHSAPSHPLPCTSCTFHINSTATAPFNPFNISYYQHYFDIDTATVRKRVLQGMIPKQGGGFVEGVCEERVDLYGPFWTLTTLILSIFLSASLSSSITRYLSQPDAANLTTSSDITLLSVSTTLIYTYGLAFPCAFWAVTKYVSNRTKGNEGAENGDVDVGAGWGIVEAVGVWGYGMGVWVPVSILCIIPIPILRWILVGGATASSGYFLVENIYPILRQARSNRIPRALMLVVLVVHVGIALAMKVLFFSYSVAGKTIGPSDPLESPIEEIASEFARRILI